MHIRTSRERLIPALTKVGGVVERRQTLPILGNLLISAGDESVQITGTDLEVEIRVDVAANVEEPGEVTLPARKFIDICRAVPEGAQVVVKVHGQRAGITAGRSRFSLSTLPASDFPLMESGGGDQTIEIEQGVLKELLEKTGFAMAHQDVRYYLNGLFLKIEPRGIIAVATDGHRMAKVEQDLELPVSGELEVILPRKTVLELNRLLEFNEEPVHIDLSERMLRVAAGDSLLTSKLVDGRYPDYQRVIPILADKVATVDREALRQSLLRTSVLSSEKYKGIRLGFSADRLSLQAHNPEQEEAEEELEIEYDQDPVAIGFNVGYLIDVLGAVDEERVEFRFTDSNSSALLRGSGREDQTFVVMPMRL
jgi:DNA polymerase-3 subunit beta